MESGGAVAAQPATCPVCATRAFPGPDSEPGFRGWSATPRWLRGSTRAGGPCHWHTLPHLLTAGFHRPGNRGTRQCRTAPTNVVARRRNGAVAMRARRRQTALTGMRQPGWILVPGRHSPGRAARHARHHANVASPRPAGTAYPVNHPARPPGHGYGGGRAGRQTRYIATDHGSIRSSPRPSKSRTLRVASVAACWRVMAAICASAVEIGRPARSRCATMSAYTSAAA